MEHILYLYQFIINSEYHQIKKKQSTHFQCNIITIIVIPLIIVIRNIKKIIRLSGILFHTRYLEQIPIIKKKQSSE